MTGEFNQLPTAIKIQLKGLAKAITTQEFKPSLDILAETWIEKTSVFEAQTRAAGMIETPHFDANDNRAAIAMTYSGSLFYFGPLVEGLREIAYVPMGVNVMIPDMIVNAESNLDQTIEVDKSVLFSAGPVKSSPLIYKISMFNDIIDPQEEEERFSAILSIIVNEFARVNGLLSLPDPSNETVGIAGEE